MGRSCDPGARGPSVPVSVQRGNPVVDRFSPGSGAHTAGQGLRWWLSLGAERVLGNDPSVHGLWLWRMFREPRGAVLSFLLAPVCHTRSLKEGPCVRPPARCPHMSLLWTLRIQGGGLGSLMSELGREVARNGPPAGGGVPPATQVPPRQSTSAGTAWPCRVSGQQPSLL